ncbi:MAG: O-antigen ligase family protein, partial [Lysobacteraceae bacterium]
MTAACMAAEPRYTWRTVLLSILVAIVPLAGSAPNTLLKAVLLLALLVTGVVLIRRQPDVRLRYRIARFIVIVCFLRLAYAFYSILWHGLRWNELDLPAQTLLYLGTAAVFATALDWRLIWKIFAVSTLVFGGSCIVQHHVMGLERAHGFSGGEWTAIEFTMVTLCMALFSVIRLIQPNVHPAERWLHGVAIAVGVYGSILAQSRGPILAFIPAMLMVIVVHVRRTRRWRGALVFVGALAIGVVGATSVLNHEVIQRFGEVSGEISGFN